MKTATKDMTPLTPKGLFPLSPEMVRELRDGAPMTPLPHTKTDPNGVED